eukprot:6105370-Amphidinium_carterae.1
MFRIYFGWVAFQGGSLNGLWVPPRKLGLLDSIGCAWPLESLRILAVGCEQHGHDSFSSVHKLWA